MQDRHFDIAGPNPTPQEQREIDQHYTAFLDQNRRSIIAAAFARKQRELTEAKLTAEAPIGETVGSGAVGKAAQRSPRQARPRPSPQPQTDKPATPPRVAVASLTPPSSPAPIRSAVSPTPRPSAAVPAAHGAKPPAKPKRGASCEPSLSCGLSQLGDGVSSLTKTIFGAAPPKKAGRS